MPAEIRSLRGKDIASCLNIYNYYILHSSATFETEVLSEEEFTERVKRITERYPWIVIVKEGNILGYAYLSEFIPRSAYDWTADAAVYLDHSARGRGYGSLIMAELIRLAEACGYCNLVSVITETNTASQKLHEKFGFVKAAHFADFGCKNGEWLGVDYYVKVLRNPDKNESLPHPVNLRL